MTIHPHGQTTIAATVALSLSLALAACDSPPAPEQPEAARPKATPPSGTVESPEAPESARPAAPLSGVSIMRPSIVDIAPAPPPPPPSEPLKAEIRFAETAHGLDDAARARLDALAGKPEMQTGGAIMVRGHTDSRGNDRDNVRTSKARAQAVADYLVEKGIDANRMTIVALGETRPLAPNAHLDGSDDPEGRARNRRVEIEVAPLTDTTANAAGETPKDNAPEDTGKVNLPADDRTG